MTDQMGVMEKSQFRKLHGISQQAVSVSDQSRPPTCPDEVATRRASILLGCYRKGDAEDPQTFVAAVASILASYPQEVAYRVTDPRSGLPGKSKWLPTPAEVREACEAEMAPARAWEAQQRRREETERNLAPANAKRVEAARWADLIAAIGPPLDRPGINPKSEEWLLEYGRRPLKISDDLARNLATLKYPNPSVS